MRNRPAATAGGPEAPQNSGIPDPIVTIPLTPAQSFAAHCAAFRPLLIYFIRRSGAADDDFEPILAEISVRAWKRYPAMLRREQEALAAGAPSPHKWKAWFQRITEHYLIDLYRAREGRHKKPAGGEDAAEQPVPGSTWCITPAQPRRPLFRTGDPEAGLIQRQAYRALGRAIETLPAELREQVLVMLDDQSVDDFVAAGADVSRMTLFRRRREACVRLRAALEAAGYGAPDFLDPSHLAR